MGYFEATYDNQNRYNPFDNCITIDTSMRKGKGVGSFLKGVYRSVLPLVKRGNRAVGKAVGKEALRAGVNILDDIIHEKPFKESFRNNIGESGKNLKRKAEEKLDNLISRSGYKTKRRVRKQQSSTNSDTVNTKNINRSEVKTRKKPCKNKRKTLKEKRTARDIIEE